MGADPDTLWLKLLETEQALIPEGLHVLGAPMSAEAIAAQVALMDDAAAHRRVAAALAEDHEIPVLSPPCCGPWVAA